ncbi:MAG: HIT family protein [Planctomycetota bacterium]
MAETVFSKILSGELPCHKVYEDERVLAFLDAYPVSRGHTLVIPKEPAETLGELSDDDAAAIGRALPRICRGVTRAIECPGYNVLQNNGADAHQAVMHVHFHVIPVNPHGPEGGPNGPGLGVHWPAGKLPEDAADLAARIQRLI